MGIIEGNWRACGYNDLISWSLQFIPDFLHEENQETLICHGFITDAIDGLGAMAMADRKTTKPGMLFQSDVVQPKFNPEWPNDQ